MSGKEEYRGQEVVAQVDTRLVPPNNNYPDCECSLVLTKQHLYVLEDNYDGTFETHFDFVLKEIDDIEVKTETSYIQTGGGESTGTYLLSAVLGFFGGIVSLPGGRREKNVRKTFFVLYYHTEQGRKDFIYFHKPASGTRKFIRAFHKCKGI